MFFRKRSTLAVVAVLLVLVGSFRLWEWERERRANRDPVEAPPLAPSSALAFAESYLDAAAGCAPSFRTGCVSCHPTREGLDHFRWQRLRRRENQPRETWAEAIQLQARCGSCHVLPDPSTLPWPSWNDVMARMPVLMEARNVPPPKAEEMADIAHYFYTFSRAAQRPLEREPDPLESPLWFESLPLGRSVLPKDPLHRPAMGEVNLVDLDRDGRLDVLACDLEGSAVSWLHQVDGTWREETLARLPHPARAHVVVNVPARPREIVVACLGTMQPVDDLAGAVVLLREQDEGQFNTIPLLAGVSRIADVQARDFNGDGELDFVVAAYGYLNQGEVGWLEACGHDAYSYHVIVAKTGAINVWPVDLNGDGQLDFVTLFAQQHEEVTAYINRGRGVFEERLLFKAATPAFGSSGIQLVDLDQDGDIDILYTNGDNMDLPNVLPRPFHGVQWLENMGDLKFVWHDIYRFYGAYSAAAGDLNNDGKLDVVVASLFNDWSDPHRASLMWLENDGRQRFRPHTIARQPIHLISTAVGDVDGDGCQDIIAAGMNAFAPFERMGRIQMWRNLGPVESRRTGL